MPGMETSFQLGCTSAGENTQESTQYCISHINQCDTNPWRTLNAFERTRGKSMRVSIWECDHNEAVSYPYPGWQFVTSKVLKISNGRSNDGDWMRIVTFPAPRTPMPRVKLLWPATLSETICNVCASVGLMLATKQCIQKRRGDSAKRSSMGSWSNGLWEDIRLVWR